MTAATAVAGIGDGVSADSYRHSSTPLNAAMSFGRVVWSDGNGHVYESFTGPAPYIDEVCYLNLDADGSSLDDDYENVPDGWTPLVGFSGAQGAGRSSTMHASEFIGGGLERHIRENAGYYVAVMVDGQYDGPPPEWETDEHPNVGWAVFHRATAS